MGDAGASGMSAGIVVSMNQVVVVTAEVLATVSAEFRGWLAAPLLMLLQLIRTPESTNVANLYLLTRLQRRIQSDTLAGNRFDDSRMRSLCRGARMSLAL